MNLMCCDTHDVCHVLLGAPRLFDRRVMHEGRLNTYSFTKNHKKITLIPLKPSHTEKPKDNPYIDIFPTTLLKSQWHAHLSSKDLLLQSLDPK